MNRCTFIGNLGQDPEIRYTPDGSPIATISVGVNEKWKDGNGQKQERTEWVRCVAFKRLAEIIETYLQKGSHVYIDGKMQTRSWEDKNTGETKYSTEIVLREMEMLGRTKEADKPKQPAKQPHTPPPAPDFNDFDDFDVPF